MTSSTGLITLKDDGDSLTSLLTRLNWKVNRVNSDWLRAAMRHQWRRKSMGRRHSTRKMSQEVEKTLQSFSRPIGGRRGVGGVVVVGSLLLCHKCMTFWTVINKPWCCTICNFEVGVEGVGFLRCWRGGSVEVVEGCWSILKESRGMVKVDPPRNKKKAAAMFIEPKESLRSSWRRKWRPPRDKIVGGEGSDHHVTEVGGILKHPQRCPKILNDPDRHLFGVSDEKLRRSSELFRITKNLERISNNPEERRRIWKEWG